MIRKILCVIFFCAAGSLQAQNVFTVDDAVIERNFMPNELPFYIDKTNSLSFLQISSDGFANRFERDSTYQNKDFKTNTTYWVRLPIRHNAKTKNVWLLEFYDQTIDHIEAYVPQT